ncbi:MAG: hypothetical protein KatS3mg082_1849 [Nitrospiraceae bacterium]|nr:MAG: hypothetical protein KatS3mg082_1849 [Nitrospiraceae bacterium]
MSASPGQCPSGAYKVLRFLVVLLLGLLKLGVTDACASSDRVESLLISLGRRGVNVDDALVDLNKLVSLKDRPERARQLYADVEARLEAKMKLVQKTPRSTPNNKLIARLAAGGLRVMAVTAHPDDENMMSGLLAFGRDNGVPVLLLCLTRGEAGETPHAGGLHAEALGRKRSEELRGAAAALGIDHTIARFTNGAFKEKYPGKKFWLPEEVIAAWRDTRDPEQVVAAAAKTFRPDIIVTIEPNWGWTGNPEHRAAAELAKKAAARVGAEVVYAVTSDAVFTDEFDTSRWPAKRAMDYWAVKVSAARHHASQYKLPPDSEKHPEQFPDLSVEHFRACGRTKDCR